MSNLSSSVKKAISIPYRIKRSPTDLLKALSNTVKLDPNTPHYSLIDDSLLTSINPNDVRRSYLSKASGIKAAKFMIEKYPEAFMKDDCVPHVKSFFPKYEFSEEELKYPTENLIYSLMSWGKLSLAYDSYLKCKDQNIEVSEECKHVLLDLLSINNSNDSKEKVPIMEEWYLKGQTRDMESKPRYIPANTWVKGGKAEQMFNELKSKSAASYCSLIKGMTKYNDAENATTLYNEMKHYNLTPDLNTINSMIKIISLSPPEVTNDKKIEIMLQRLNEIKNYGMLPNLKTFNTCFELIKSFNLFQRSVPLTLDLFKEMQNLKIEPSLSTYSHIVSIFYPNRDIGVRTGVLGQVINEIEKMAQSENGLVWKDVDDPLFFKIAMEKLSLGTPENLPLAKKLNGILFKENNIKFLNDSYLINKYFEFYLTTLIKFDLPENVIDEWRFLTPYIYGRSIIILDRMIDFVSKNKCFDFVPELWSNCLEFKSKRLSDFWSDTIESLLNIMGQYEEDNQELISKYSSIAEIMIKNYPYAPLRIETDSEDDLQPLEYNWNSKMLSNLFIVLLRGNKLEAAWNEFENYMKNQNKIAGELSEKSILNLCEALIGANRIDNAFEVLKLAVSLQLPILKGLISKLRESNLSSEQHTLLKQLKNKLSL
ncbi:unnamed protein product [Brachionus calyciflorus]|uniref:Small ribosomal subunit protein mS39 n=1 Tax=Brachionus calyciflorus TaxID=104777 RepID=A0A814BXD7_9BILA|nr:unnamed protein product [Brachionus calyciflorus]